MIINSPQNTHKIDLKNNNKIFAAKETAVDEVHHIYATLKLLCYIGIVIYGLWILFASLVIPGVIKVSPEKP